jgi:hypothetical protein
VFKKLWEKYDQWVAVVLTLSVLFGLIKLVLWAEPIVQSKTLLRFLLGWLFK